MLNMGRDYTLRRTWSGIRLVEEIIRNILTDEKLSAIKAVLEKDHAIDCIFLLKLEKL